MNNNLDQNKSKQQKCASESQKKETSSTPRRIDEGKSLGKPTPVKK